MPVMAIEVVGADAGGFRQFDVCLPCFGSSGFQRHVDLLGVDYVSVEGYLGSEVLYIVAPYVGNACEE